MKLYQRVAQLMAAYESRAGLTQAETIRAKIEAEVSDHMPSGSGFDSGTEFDLERSRADRLVFSTAFHHMNASGVYTEWTKHDVVVTPSLAWDFTVKVTGRNYNGIKDYIAEVFAEALRYTKEVQ